MTVAAAVPVDACPSLRIAEPARIPLAVDLDDGIALSWQGGDDGGSRPDVLSQ